MQKEILKLIRELQRETGTAVLFVTHDMGVVAKISQKVTVLFAGKVMEDAPTEQVFSGAAHPYTRALINATPSSADPSRSFTPVPAQLVADLHREIAQDDHLYMTVTS